MAFSWHTILTIVLYEYFQFDLPLKLAIVVDCQWQEKVVSSHHSLRNGYLRIELFGRMNHALLGNNFTLRRKNVH